MSIKRPSHNGCVSVRPQVVVYVKPGHASSGAAVATVERVRKQVPFDLQQVDVNGDAELTKKFGAEVPVVTINGKRAFQGTVVEAAFKKRLKKAKTQSSGKKEVPASPTNAPPEKAPVDNPPAGSAAATTGARSIPAALMVVVLLAVILGVGYFVREGVAEAAYGRGRLARELLKVKVRDEAPPSFVLESLQGQKIRSDDRFRDKVVFINFWATWCPPCVEEMPSMLRLQEKMGNDPRFEMLAISTDEEWQPVRAFFDGPPPFKVLLDQEGKLAKRYGTQKFPETYIVVDGRLVGYIVGPRDWDTWYAETYLRAITEHGTDL